MGPQDIMFYCIFNKEFSEIWGLCCSMGPYFFEKSAKNSIHSRIFLQKKINVLRFKIISNGKILKNFDEITYNTSHWPFLENFEKFERF